ncbi:hypothetical protein HMPREF0591_4084, partial [Mycobacterium parascrofulaceum ATCC BAA-614]
QRPGWLPARGNGARHVERRGFVVDDRRDGEGVGRIRDGAGVQRALSNSSVQPEARWRVAGSGHHGTTRGRAYPRSSGARRRRLPWGGTFP